MKKKELIKMAYTSGYTGTGQLARLYGTTEKYVKKVLRDAGLRKENRPALTVARYIEAVRHGFATVESLAHFFNVSERTIKYFHAKTLVRERLSEYLFILNKTNRYLGKKRHDECNTLGDVCAMLDEICNGIAPLAADYKQAAENIRTIRKTIAYLKKIKP